MTALLRATRAALLAAAALAVVAPAAHAATASQTYLVLYKQSAVPGDAAATLARAGGTLVAAYDQIGVAVARSSDATFAPTLRRDARVDGVAATSGLGVRAPRDEPDGAARAQPKAPASDNDTQSGVQWDMRQIHTPEAHAITGGSRSVVVGDIDTGLDFTHPDLAPNYDAADSADCSSGAPAPLAPGNDVNGHGTHTAGTIAAASNGVGIVGVAPNVRIAGIKSATDDGFFFPEMVVCAFVWAGTHNIDVTNNSYFVDPWLYNCRNDAEQRAIWKAVQRAIRFAMNQGTTVVSAAGNESDDLAHPEVDVTSPDFPPGSEQERAVTNACVVLPVEIPGVIGVSADGNTPQPNGGYLKSFYSSYGIGVVDVVAPGGDSVFGRTPQAPNGRVLSTWPATSPCARPVTDAATGALYCYAQGTSMASPHVAGVAALVVSVLGDARTPQNGRLRPGRVASVLTQTADPQPCPSALPAGYLTDWPRPSGTAQTCQGGPGNNSWYGSGQVDALAAVTGASGVR